MPTKLLHAIAFLLAGVFFAPALAVRGEEPKAFEAQLRALEKEIAAVRGLEFKTPVKARVIARPANASKNVQGYYGIKDKTLFLYDDVKDSYRKGVLVHEMVHALQDQHFDLAKLKSGLHLDKYDDDADLALAALIEGDATYTMIELLKKDQPKVATMLDAPLDKAKNLQNAFLYAQGARYVKALKERGGWASVNFAYKFPPRTTAAIFNLKSVASIDLGPGISRGAFFLFKQLAENPATNELGLEAARSWRGDLIVELKSGKVWIVACRSPESATLLQAALGKLKAEQAGLQADKQEENAATWKSADGAIQGVLKRGQRVYQIEAASAKAYLSLLDQLEGPPKLSVYSTRDRKTISFGAMIERLLDADLICVGETHDSDLHHRVQLQIIKALFAYDERLGVGLEMFQRPFQKEIDRYMRGESDEAEFLKTSEYQQRWGYEWALYRPIVDFCRKNHVPLAALNVSKELTGKISKGGFAKLSEEDKKQLGDIDFQLKEHRDYWYERLAKMHGSAQKTTAEQKERSYQVMTAWDDFMAASAAQFQQERRLRRLIVLAGSGHIERGFGIPLRAARRTGGKVLTVKIELGADPGTDSVTDFVVLVR